MQYEIFDFHTHPFLNAAQNICAHKAFVDMTPAYTPCSFVKMVRAACKGGGGERKYPTI